MNRLTLVLNTAILVVTFVVALAASDVQGELLMSSARNGGGGRVARAVGNDSPTTLLRVVQSMENFYPATPGNKLSRGQLEAIRDAIDLYYPAIRTGVDDVLGASDDDRDLRQAINQLGKSVRIDIEAALSQSFKDPSIVGRLTTEIIRHSQ